MITTTDTASTWRPAPTARPIPPVVQMLAAVVSPRTEAPIRRMAPAPKKPMPLTTWAAMRPGSFVGLPSATRMETSMSRAEPRQRMIWVRRPAG